MTSKRFSSLAGALLALLVAGSASAAGAVFTLSNDATLNEVLAFRRGSNGGLEAAVRYATGGRGSGDGLGSQGAVVLSRDGELLFAVDAGSDEISSFRVQGDRLRLVSHRASGGHRPIGLTSHDDLLYVLNAGGDGNIAGFRVDEDGTLEALPGSSRPLSGKGVGPAQVEFSPDGDFLVVTEKATNRIDIYQVDEDGSAQGPTVKVSSGQTPFGFAFTPRGVAIVSEAFGGAPTAGAVSSYAIAGGSLATLSATVPDHQGAPCWVVITGDGRTAFTSNTASGSISAYRVGRDGRLALLQADGIAASTDAGSAPIDMALTRGSRFLYALDSGTHAMSAFRVGPGGDLAALPGVSGLPAHAVGLAAR